MAVSNPGVSVWDGQKLFDSSLDGKNNLFFFVVVESLTWWISFSLQFSKTFPKVKTDLVRFPPGFSLFLRDKNCLFSPRLSNSHWPHTNSGSFWEWSCITSRALLKRMSILGHKAVRHGGREGGKKRPLHKLADEKGRQRKKEAASCRLLLLLSQIQKA